MEDKRIEVVRNQPRLKSVRDIQVFLGFTSFYYCFIQHFSKIAASLISILRTSIPFSRSLSDKITDKMNDEIVEGENKSGDNVFLSKELKNAKSKNWAYVWNLRAMGKLTFLTLSTRKAFNQ